MQKYRQHIMADDDDSGSGESDESLDARSEKFDPLKVLYSPRSRLASSDAPIYDNVSKFESVLKNLGASATKVRIAMCFVVVHAPFLSRHFV